MAIDGRCRFAIACRMVASTWCVSALDLEFEAARLRNLRDLGFLIKRVVATGNAGPASAALKFPPTLSLNCGPWSVGDDYVSYMRGVPADVHTALVLWALNGSPPKSNDMVLAKSVHFTTWRRSLSIGWRG
jgi:hypothetical protein